MGLARSDVPAPLHKRTYAHTRTRTHTHTHTHTHTDWHKGQIFYIFKKKSGGLFLFEYFGNIKEQITTILFIIESLTMTRNGKCLTRKITS